MKLTTISRRLSKEVDQLTFEPPVAHCYNPLAYARKPHELYLERYGKPKKEAILVGMNPGPFGMAQTGVPFGDVSMVRDWLGIEAEVESIQGHPKRPIQGFACSRSEVSGSRLWGWAQDRFKTPDRFFDKFFVWNYCPLCFMEDTGRNRTPDKLPAEEREQLFAVCDDALRAVVEELKPSIVIGVGRFARDRIDTALADFSVEKGTVLHPSPASPAANRGWAEAAEKSLRELGVMAA